MALGQFLKTSSVSLKFKTRFKHEVATSPKVTTDHKCIVIHDVTRMHIKLLAGMEFLETCGMV